MKLLKILNLIKKGRLNSSKGFSLVELMVVVAVIGILAAIAIPNYQKFQRKARQGEAKIGLSGMHRAVTIFAAEWGVGTPNLIQMGYSPEGQIQYNIGWENSQTAAIPATANVNAITRPGNYRGPTVASGDINKINTFVAFPGKMVFGANNAIGADTVLIKVGTGGSCTVAACTSQSTCENNDTCNSSSPGTWTPNVGSVSVDNTRLSNPSYIIGAAGNIGGTLVDRWTMSSGKVLTNTKNGAE